MRTLLVIGVSLVVATSVAAERTIRCCTSLGECREFATDEACEAFLASDVSEQPTVEPGSKTDGTNAQGCGLNVPRISGRSDGYLVAVDTCLPPLAASDGRPELMCFLRDVVHADGTGRVVASLEGYWIASATPHGGYSIATCATCGTGTIESLHFGKISSTNGFCF